MKIAITMKPFMLTLQSYMGGEDVFEEDTNIGQIILNSADTNATLDDPVSFFQPSLRITSSLSIFETLVMHFSGCEKNRIKIIDLSSHTIWLWREEGYEKRVIGKISGCRAREEFPYSSYNLGFTPYFFFFDPNFQGRNTDWYDPGLLQILKKGRQYILDDYQSLIGLNLREEKIQVEMSDFFWENDIPNFADWGSWICYFIKEKLSSRTKEVDE